MILASLSFWEVLSVLLIFSFMWQLTKCMNNSIFITTCSSRLEFDTCMRVFNRINTRIDFTWTQKVNLFGHGSSSFVQPLSSFLFNVASILKKISCRKINYLQNDLNDLCSPATYKLWTSCKLKQGKFVVCLTVISRQWLQQMFQRVYFMLFFKYCF